MKIGLWFLIALALIVSACGSDSTDPNGYQENTIENGGGILTSNYSKPPNIIIDQDKTYTADIVTNKGSITVELLGEEAPITVNNFVFLSREGFYDNAPFHRIIKGFMVQGGDPTGTGRGGPGYTFKDEPVTRDYVRGTVAMANAGPNTNGSQFFIVHANTNLPKNYNIFGLVKDGMDVLDTIAQVPVTRSPSGEISQPTEKVFIESVTISEE